MRPSDSLKGDGRRPGRAPADRACGVGGPVAFDLAAARRVMGLIAGLAGSFLVVASCEGMGGAMGERDAVARASASVVDTVYPLDEELRRFRATLTEVPDRLSGGAQSRDALIERFVRSIETSDTLAFQDMLITPAEFGHLYYPHTMYTEAPYYLPPSLLWFQMENATSRGSGRIMSRLFGRPLHVTGYRCSEEPEAQGLNRIWSRCVLRIDPPDAEPYDFRLFGSILERDGIFKFLSYSNDL